MKNSLSRAFRRISESAAIARFGDGAIERTRLFIALINRSFAHTLTRTSDTRLPNIATQFVRNGIHFPYIFHSHEELMLFYEIFCREMYQLPKDDTLQYIVDLGANAGISTLYLHTQYPKARILAVEANPRVCARLRDAVAGILSVQVVCAAATGRDGPVILHLSADGTVGSSLTSREGSTGSVTVEGKSLRTLLRDAGFPRVDCMKFDVEGAEWDAFSLFPERAVVRLMAGEFHEDLSGHSISEFVQLLQPLECKVIPMNKTGRYIVSARYA